MDNKIYCEEGGRWLVKVISDEIKPTRSDGKMRTVEMECLGTIRAPTGFAARGREIPDGTIMKSEALEGYEAYVGWHLLDLEYALSFHLISQDEYDKVIVQG
jgi:hypothetical protein